MPAPAGSAHSSDIARLERQAVAPVPGSVAMTLGRCLENEIVVIDGFLSDAECGAILGELECAYWQPSLTYKPQADGSYHNVLTDMRVSETAHQDLFSDELKAILGRIELRLDDLFSVDAGDLEPWQATDYCRDGKFDYHLDAGYWDGHRAGDRILTFLLYLNTPRQGGGTHFRALDRNVEARSGRLLVWHNLFANGDCNHRMIHSGAPVLEGRKTTLVSWQRQRRYRDPAKV